MADTIRTKTALLALYVIGTAGGITAQRLRDFVVSVMGCYGSIVIQGGSTGQTIAVGTPEKFTEWTADGPANGTTPAFATDEITIDNAGVYEVFFQTSFAGITNCVFEFVLRKDAVIAGPGCQRKTANTDVGSASFQCHITMAAAEVLSIWVEGNVNGSFTAVDTQFTVKRIG